MGQEVGSIEKNRKKEVKTHKKGFISSWWVILFITCCSFYHMHSMHKKNKTYAYLQSRIQELEDQKNFAEKKREDLLLEISSQQDPAWVEMVMMKGLGVVPEGSRKVYFTEE